VVVAPFKIPPTVLPSYIELQRVIFKQDFQSFLPAMDPRAVDILSRQSVVDRYEMSTTSTRQLSTSSNLMPSSNTWAFSLLERQALGEKSPKLKYDRLRKHQHWHQRWHY
jgi:hypothetical protein